MEKSQEVRRTYTFTVTELLRLVGCGPSEKLVDWEWPRVPDEQSVTLFTSEGVN
jgi:hypothetical protein